MRTRLPLALLLGLTSCVPRASAAPGVGGTVELVESAPLETDLDHADIADAWEVWPTMIRGAKRSLDVAQFYIADAPGGRLAPVLAAIEEAADRGVAVRLLVDSHFSGKYPEPLARLGGHKGITLRKLDVGREMGGGVLHAKYFIVDGQEVFLGSQNFDWRSLTHIQEMGVRLRDPAAAAAFTDVFDMDWDLAAGTRRPTAPPRPRSYPEVAAGERAAVTPVFSPEKHLPYAGSWELPKIVELIDGARKTVHVQVLTYKASSRDGSGFHDLDDALRRAAARGVQVELLVADWSKRQGEVDAVKRLAKVPGISVRFLDIPAWSGGFVPFARVGHAKYMVVDGARVWIGTSNWEGGYFKTSRNVGLIIEGPALGARLDRVFRDGFAGPYAEPVDPERAYEPPVVDHQKR